MQDRTDKFKIPMREAAVWGSAPRSQILVQNWNWNVNEYLYVRIFGNFRREAAYKIVKANDALNVPLFWDGPLVWNYS